MKGIHHQKFSLLIILPNPSQFKINFNSPKKKKKTHKGRLKVTLIEFGILWSLVSGMMLL
jgi:hypothetical protein